MTNTRYARVQSFGPKGTPLRRCNLDLASGGGARFPVRTGLGRGGADIRRKKRGHSQSSARITEWGSEIQHSLYSPRFKLVLWQQ